MCSKRLLLCLVIAGGTVQAQMVIPGDHIISPIKNWSSWWLKNFDKKKNRNSNKQRDNYGNTLSDGWKHVAYEVTRTAARAVSLQCGVRGDRKHDQYMRLKCHEMNCWLRHWGRGKNLFVDPKTTNFFDCDALYFLVFGRVASWLVEAKSYYGQPSLSTAAYPDVQAYWQGHYQESVDQESVKEPDPSLEQESSQVMLIPISPADYKSDQNDPPPFSITDCDEYKGQQ